MSTRKNTDKPWHDIPPEVQAAVKELHRKFEQLHATYGPSTQVLCRDCIRDTSGDPSRTFRYEFDALWVSIPDEWLSPEVRNHYFFSLARPEIQSFTFREFFNFTLDILTAGVRPIFAELIEIALKHGLRIEGARAEAVQMIHRHSHFMEDWVRGVATGKQADPALRQALAFLTMTPAGPDPYDPERAREPLDAATSAKVIETYVGEYVNRLESEFDEQAGKVIIAAAKHPPAAAKTIEGSSEGNTPERLESQDDHETNRQNLIAKLWSDDPKKRTRYFTQKESAIICAVAERTISRWIGNWHEERRTGHSTRKKKLEPEKRGRSKEVWVTNESLRNIVPKPPE